MIFIGKLLIRLILFATGYSEFVKCVFGGKLCSVPNKRLEESANS